MSLEHVGTYLIVYDFYYKSYIIGYESSKHYVKLKSISYADAYIKNMELVIRTVNCMY